MLRIKNIAFAYEKKAVLDDIEFEVRKGEHLSIIGESGSGKSTLLKLIYGEFDLHRGQIFWNETEILGPKHNLVVGYGFMKMVSQEFDLMPFISVEENIGKFLSNFFPEEKKERIEELLEVVQLNEFAKTKVKNLSGGQKQRVALARSLAKPPEILLLDEPFSHIDNFKKQSLRRSLFDYLKKHNVTCIVATHDCEDVLGHSDQMVVLHNSKIIAKDNPENLYQNPNSSLIASFFGEYNLIDGQTVYDHQLMIKKNGEIAVEVYRSYFKGSYHLIEGRNKSQKILFRHSSSIEKGTIVHLAICPQ